MAVIHFSKEGFDKAVAQGSPMLVDFWASWCGPCKMLAPTVDKLAEKYDGKVIVGKVDVDEEQELARQFGVMSIPTVVLFKDGKDYKDDVYVSVNGENCRIQRGVPVKIKRKFALVLEQSQAQDVRAAEFAEARQSEYNQQVKRYNI